MGIGINPYGPLSTHPFGDSHDGATMARSSLKYNDRYMCVRCHDYPAKWLMPVGRVCGYCRRYYRSKRGRAFLDYLASLSEGRSFRRALRLVD